MAPRGYWREAPTRERRDVTVCIAAVCEMDKQPKLILCTDYLVSGPLGRAEIKLKQRTLGSSWYCLTAGVDADIHAFYRALRSKFTELGSHQTALDETNVGGLVRDALAAHKKQKVDERVRGQYAISYDDLLNIGKEKLPPELFREAMTQVRDASIGAEFIVAGFSGRFPMVFQTDANGGVSVREDFAVIGEGGYLAQTVLLHRAHSDVSSTEEALYTVYEAKKYAEGATSVGSFTTITVIHADRRRQRLTKAGRDFLKQQYDRLGPKSIPPDLQLTEEMFVDVKVAP